MSACSRLRQRRWISARRIVVVDSEKVPTLSISAVGCPDRGIDDARLSFDGYRASFRIRRIMRVVYKAS
jgi:hypothetical protein